MATVLALRSTTHDDVQILWGLRCGPAGYMALCDRIGDADRTIDALDRLMARGRIRRTKLAGTTYYERVPHG